MKYSVGDKVRVRKDLKVGKCYGEQYFAEEMKKNIGKTLKINSIKEDLYVCRDYDDYDFWYYNDEMLEPVEDIIEYKGKKYDVVHFMEETILSNAALYLKEHKEEILDKAEKRYLSTVIKPFKNEVEYICRNARYNGTLKKGGYSYISIKCKNDDDFCYRTGLPIFETDKMYKGMKLDKEYTLEQLGLEE